MSWRNVLITNPCKLSFWQNQLVISNSQDEYTVPLEDVNLILVERREVIITVPLLAKLSEYKISLIVCNDKYLPCGYFLPYNSYYRQLKIIQLQTKVSTILKKSLHKKIIQQKIVNQSQVLKLIGNDNLAQDFIKLSKKVLNGDPYNMEAYCARLYYKKLWGDHFIRKQNNKINILLNYGYSIFRASVSRNIAINGYIPSLGIFHHSELNNFNLSDDLIEPFRPLVDLAVYNFMQRDLFTVLLEKLELDPTDKQYLISVLNMDMKIENKKHNALNAIEITVSSLQKALEMEQAKYLLLPQIMKL